MTGVFSDLKAAPWWWEAAPRRIDESSAVPAEVDALIVGAGFSGLTAARVLAKAGLSVLVCDSGFLGIGASTRNGGMLGPSFHKLGGEGLIARYGVERTHRILNESIGFVAFVKSLIDEEQIDCDFRQVGRFRGASRARDLQFMARELEAQQNATGIEAQVVSRSQVREEIGTGLFLGGVRYQIDGGLHPGKYHDGLVQAARNHKAIVAANTKVKELNRSANGFRVSTSAGTVETGRVAICTNAYTSALTPWFRRRILPIRSSMIATDELDSELLNRLMPTGRMYGDSRRVMAYYRPSPDGKRILFGGRATSSDRALLNATKLRVSMLDVFPELEKTRITHSWSGLVGYAFDHVPHLGQHDGLYYAMGYCGSGVARASYFGTKLGYKMLGDEHAGRTSFDDLPFDTKPFYAGNPWFMSPIIQWHRMLDRLGV